MRPAAMPAPDTNVSNPLTSRLTEAPARRWRPTLKAPEHKPAVPRTAVLNAKPPSSGRLLPSRRPYARPGFAPQASRRDRALSPSAAASRFAQGEGFFFVAADLVLAGASDCLALASASLSAASFVSRSDFSRAVFTLTACA